MDAAPDGHAPGRRTGTPRTDHAHQHADVEAHDLKYKGLRKGSVSIVAAVAIGLAATAPAYSLTGALGYGALESGYQLPIVFVISVIPMFFVALAYKHMTTVAADSGTVFTWGSMAIGPRTGWIGGWGLFLSSTLAGVGAAEVMVNSVVTVTGMEDPPPLPAPRRSRRCSSCSPPGWSPAGPRSPRARPWP